MNINFGLFPPLTDIKKGRKSRMLRYEAYTNRAKTSWLDWLKRTSFSQAK